METGLQQLEQKLAAHEKASRVRGAALTLIPIVVAALAVWYGAEKLNHANQQLAVIQKKQDQAANTLELVVQISREIQDSIETKVEAARSPQEAQSLIDLRMMFDRIDTQYTEASKVIPNLPPLEHRDWIAIVLSSPNVDDARAAARTWSSKVDPAQLAIYKAANGFYALAIKGDGTFTTAYNNMESAWQKGSPKAYFAPSANWGTDYLK